MRRLLGRAVLLAGLYAFTLQTVFGAAALAASLAGLPPAALCAEHAGPPQSPLPDGAYNCPCGPVCTSSGCPCSGLMPAAAGEGWAHVSAASRIRYAGGELQCMPARLGSQPARAPPVA